MLFLKQMNKCLSLKAFLRLHYLCQLKLCFWKRSSGTSSRVTKKSKWKPWLRRGERQPLVCSWPLHHPTDQILGHRKNPPVFIKSNWEASFVLRFLRAEELQPDKGAGYCLTMALLLSEGKSFIPSFTQNKATLRTVMQITGFEPLFKSSIFTFRFVLFRYYHEVDSINH